MRLRSTFSSGLHYQPCGLEHRVAATHADFLPGVERETRICQKSPDLPEFVGVCPAPDGSPVDGDGAELLVLIAARCQLGLCPARQQRIHRDSIAGKCHCQGADQTVESRLGRAVGFVACPVDGSMPAWAQAGAKRN